MIYKNDTAPCTGKKLIVFQQRILELDRGNYDVLDEDDFATELVRYMSRLVREGHEDVAIRIFTKLGECSRKSNENLRTSILSIVGSFHHLNMYDILGDYTKITQPLLRKWQ